jgi:hypothetical protein
MEILTEGDAVFVPFVVTRSKNGRAVIGENGTIVALPEEEVIDFIADIKQQIKDGSIYDGIRYLYITDIFTDNTGFPIGASVIFADHSYSPDLYMGFTITHDNMRDPEIVSMGISKMGYNLLYTKGECN